LSDLLTQPDLDGSAADDRGVRVVRGRVTSSAYRRFGQRCLDLVVGVPVLIVLSPVMLSVALAVRLTQGRTVIFRQERLTQDGRAFTCLKFRTMEPDRRIHADDFDGADRRECHKSDSDPRHTALGRILRKYSLDELPQLFNVVRGDMALVGPRPEMVSVATPAFVDHPRHQVKAGMTGPFQLSELRESGRLTDGLALDLDYVLRQSLRTDLMLLGRTIVFCVRGTGS
jgi:lipopolysaccharide/colanic/teichoic acid biosynthesis glycosyltransferase